VRGPGSTGERAVALNTYATTTDVADELIAWLDT
jgi:hypothetical protein